MWNRVLINMWYAAGFLFSREKNMPQHSPSSIIIQTPHSFQYYGICAISIPTCSLWLSIFNYCLKGVVWSTYSAGTDETQRCCWVWRELWRWCRCHDRNSTCFLWTSYTVRILFINFVIVSSAVDVTNCRLDLADYSVTRFSSKTPEVYAHELLLPSIQESWVNKKSNVHGICAMV